MAQKGKNMSSSTFQDTGNCAQGATDATFMEFQPDKDGVVSGMMVHYHARWHTPNVYLEAAREVMGDIDCDPASNAIAQKRIRARVYYTAETNGLDKDWTGRVFICPPYTPQELLIQFMDKAIEQCAAGITSEIIILIHTQETWEPWFQSLLGFMDAVCFVRGLIAWAGDHEINPLFTNLIKPSYDIRGSCFFYKGPNLYEFSHVFSRFGRVLYG